MLGMGWVMAPARHLRGALFGNVVMSRLPIRQHSQCDLSWRTCEPRCCQRVDIEIGNDTLHCITSTSARRSSNGATRPAGSVRSSTTAALASRKSCSATSTNGCAAWRPKC